MTKSIQEIHTTKTGKVSDKWESYLEYYDKSLLSIKNDPISMLEIGIQNGGSLETWSTYFPFASILIGCDIDTNCSKLAYDDPRINLIIGDANKHDAYTKISNLCSAFDLIIDDGSHQSTDIINSFLNYFPLIKPGGRYIIEDSHCLYMKSFGGGIMNDYSAQSFFKKITDIISYQWWKDDVTLENYFQTFFPNTSIPYFITEGWIDSIEFRNSIITINKSMIASHEKLGKRIISGKEALVQNWGGINPS